MRFLVDNSVSWRVSRQLREAGHDSLHIADLGLADADDPTVFGRALAESRILLTQDSDFGAIHSAATNRIGVVLLRLTDGRPSTQSKVLIANLPAIHADLSAGAFVTIDNGAVRIAGP